MKGKNKVVFAVFGFMVFFFSMEAKAVDWKHVLTSATGGEWYYDAQSISRGQDIASVWTKWILSDKERAKFMEEFSEEFRETIVTNKAEESPSKLLRTAKRTIDISFFVQKEEINCSKNVARIISMSLYNSDGEVIWSSGAGPNQFEDVFPDSKGATLIKAICGRVKG